MYESPIQVDFYNLEPQFKSFVEKINEGYENRIIATIQEKLNVQVNKEELIKALNYDREQYIKGYGDAKATFYKKGNWEPIPCANRYRCSCCKSVSNLVVGAFGIVMDGLSPFCPDCGADLREEEEK